MKNSIKNTREKGNIGEEIACVYLKKHGFSIQERNYLKKWGEIDILAIKDGVLNFIEVKSIIDRGSVKGYRPEENVSIVKSRRLRRVIQTYLDERKYGLDAEFRFHVITVKTNEMTGRTYVKMIKDLIL